MRIVASIGVLGLLLAASLHATPARLQLAAADEPGERLRMAITVHAAAPGPYELHAYQTDASGRYTPERPMDEPHARLNAHATLAELPVTVELSTIRPGPYPHTVRLGDRDRHIPAHIHLDVLSHGQVLEHWQMVFADDTLLVDPYWHGWVARLHQPVAQVTRRAGVWTGVVTLHVGAAR